MDKVHSDAHRTDKWNLLGNSTYSQEHRTSPLLCTQRTSIPRANGRRKLSDGITLLPGTSLSQWATPGDAGHLSQSRDLPPPATWASSKAPGDTCWALTGTQARAGGRASQPIKGRSQIRRPQEAKPPPLACQGLRSSPQVKDGENPTDAQ